MSLRCRSRSYRGAWFRPKSSSKNILLTGPKFHCNTTGGSAVIKKNSFGEGGRCSFEGLRSEYKLDIRNVLVNKRANLNNI